MVELPTRALSLIQPWAWAVIHGPKDIENRTWWSGLRGPLWIAASAQVTRRYYDQAKELIEDRVPGLFVPPLDALDYGCIIGRASIVDCILPGGFKLENEDRDHGAIRAEFRRARVHGRPLGPRHPLHPHRWHFRDQFGYVLADRVALPAGVPCKGLQRMWRVPAPVLAQLRGVVAA